MKLSCVFFYKIGVTRKLQCDNIGNIYRLSNTNIYSGLEKAQVMKKILCEKTYVAEVMHAQSM